MTSLKEDIPVEETQCVICARKLGQEPPRQFGDPAILSSVYDGLRFRAHGNFGSTVFDPPPMSDEFIEIIVCDKCIQELSDLGRVRHVYGIRTTRTAIEEPFDPEKDDR